MVMLPWGEEDEAADRAFDGMGGEGVACRAFQEGQPVPIRQSITPENLCRVEALLECTSLMASLHIPFSNIMVVEVVHYNL